ncbi:MAG: hypothetical protein ACI8UO_003604 [Verrucomicrobiales bacterium]|jgi:hypothetical protein
MDVIGNASLDEATQDEFSEGWRALDGGEIFNFPLK